MDSSQEQPREGQGVPCSRAAGGLCLTRPINGRGLPCQGRVWLKKKVQELRIGTLNVGIMTGRSREVADVMERRNIDILCVQETRWNGNKAREIGSGFKMLYSGTDERGRCGDGVVLSKEMKENVVEVERKSYRIMKVKLCCGGHSLNVVAQGKTMVRPKIKWWRLKDQEMRQSFKEKFLHSIRLTDDVNIWWVENSTMILRTAEELLGEISARGPPNDKESWWWNQDTQDKIKDRNGRVLSREECIRARWKEHFEKLLNEENPRRTREERNPRVRAVPDITREEVRRALGKMKNGNAVVPDGIPVEYVRGTAQFHTNQVRENHQPVRKLHPKGRYKIREIKRGAAFLQNMWEQNRWRPLFASSLRLCLLEKASSFRPSPSS
ncbi:uncharacterized protein [Macrobrachium rosenbergii]|uniref:uncharacterized protein n=1 Tax=Macrobrachium rosenbergii TaxID=79674 RepID=UPI0034D7219A